MAINELAISATLLGAADIHLVTAFLGLSAKGDTTIIVVFASKKMPHFNQGAKMRPRPGWSEVKFPELEA